MYTGFWIVNDHIYGPDGYTRCWIDKGHINSIDNGYTRCWVDKGHIYSIDKGYTYCWIDNGSIYGRAENLPF